MIFSDILFTEGVHSLTETASKLASAQRLPGKWVVVSKKAGSGGFQDSFSVLLE